MPYFFYAYESVYADLKINKGSFYWSTWYRTNMLRCF